MRLFVHSLLAALTFQTAAVAQKTFAGFDRNLYPGDAHMVELRGHFDFTGYWLTPPPGAARNTWAGKRTYLRGLGFGFLVLADGRLDAQILAARKKGITPDTLGRQDAALAVAAATREGFPEGTILFLDQEEGGRLLPEQAAYFFGWTEAVAATKFKPGAYLSGQPVADGTGSDGKPATITTAQDVRQQIAARHLHAVTLWVQQDACPPANGCSLPPPALSLSGTLDAAVWQYAQSPRRIANTRACAATYSSDNNCYAGVTKELILDLDAASSADPSHGR
jgi:hypothetical protein